MRNRDGNNEKGRVKFRFLEFEVEGGTPAIQEGLRNIAAALNRANGTTLRPVHSGSGRALTPKAASASEANDGQMTFDEIAPAEAEAELEPSESAADAPVESPEAGSGRKRPVRQNRTPEVLDLDLNAGSTPFKEYIAQKNPDNDSQRYLVIAAWLKDALKLDSINSDHIYTCYRAMGWNAPPDVGAPFRWMKKNGWFKAGPTKGYFIINHIGLGKVNEMKNA